MAKAVSFQKRYAAARKHSAAMMAVHAEAAAAGDAPYEIGPDGIPLLSWLAAERIHVEDTDA